MKKIVLLVLVFALILSAASCGFSIVEKPAETPVRTSAPKETDAPAETDIPEETAVPSGTAAPEETAAPAETPAPEEPGEEEPEDAGPDYANYALTGLHVLDRGFTDGKITDEASAVAVISRCSEDIGCTNALEELAPFISCSLDGENYYRMQQCFRGLPVYGRYVVAAASDEGEVLGLTTDARDIPEDLDLTPTVTEEDVRAGVTEHALYTRGVLRDDMEIQPLSEGKLVVYDLDEALGARLAYELLVENEGQYIVIVDAKTGEVLDSAEMMRTLTDTTGTTKDGSVTGYAIYDETEDVYYVGNLERGIYLYDLDDHDSQKGTEGAALVASKGDSVFGNTREESKQAPDKALRMVNHVAEIRDYFVDKLGLPAYCGKTMVYYDDGFEMGFNALGGLSGDKTYNAIRAGCRMTGQEKDILAHEYTHAIQSRFDSSTGNGLEASTIAEGLSDTFACFITGKWVVDCVFGIFRLGSHRSAEDPSKYGDPSSIKEPALNSDDEHTYATVISHAAYLMAQSGTFDEEKLELQKLWYKAMLMLPKNCRYLSLRSCMEEAAILSGCSPEQRKAVAEAFDLVGISYYDLAETYSNDITLTVYDKQDNLYDDYTVDIIKLEKEIYFDVKEYGITRITEDLYASYTQEDPEPLRLHLDDGKYRIIIIDNGNSERIVAYTVKTESSSRKTDMLALDFGADYTVARGAKLTVLDVNGEELTDYHASVRTDSGFQPITDGVIDLPEKNYYNVLLTHREGDTVYLDGFTLRIREDAPDALTCQTRFTKAPAPQEPPEKEPPEGEDPDPALAEAEAGIQGLWNTRNRLGLYSFEDGKVTFYHLCHPGDDPADRVYVKGETAEYTIEPLSEEIGKGFRITWDDQTGEYRLLDGSPDEMILYGMNDQGELQPTGFGYSDLIRFTEYSVEDIIPVVDAAAAPISEECAYTGTVRSYIAEYGELEFKSDGSGSYYLGVFLVKLIDFDRDGTEELVVGYATENAEGYCPQPKLDVWTLEEGEPVLVYEHARIGHGDIGSHCAYIEWDGRTCLVTGYSGFETALTLRAFENGHFEEILTVEMEYGDEEYRWTVNGEAVSEEEGAEISRRINEGSEKYNGYIGSPSHGAKPKAQILAELEYGYKVLGLREEIMAWYGF